MTAYRKFSDMWEREKRAPQTLGALGGLGGTHPAIRREDSSRIAPPTPPKVPKPPKATRFGEGPPNLSRYVRVFAALCERAPDHVEPGRWQQAIEDGRRFLAQWGEQAEALDWTASDVFGLHEVPANPHPSSQRLSRYGCTGLIWLLQGCPVIALTEKTAAIQSPSGSITTYPKNRKPAFGPVGDTLDDFVA
jgi:hypothetical protein